MKRVIRGEVEERQMDTYLMTLENSFQLAGICFTRELLAHFEQDSPDRGILVDSAITDEIWEEL